MYESKLMALVVFVLLSLCLGISLNTGQQSEKHVHSQQGSYVCQSRGIREMSVRLTDDAKRHIRPIQQRRLLLGAHHVVAHVPQLKAARRSAHKRDRSKRQPGELCRPRRSLVGRKLVDEVRRERELDEALDDEEDFEPRLVGLVREEGISGGGDVELAEREEDVQRGGGRFHEGFGVEGDEVES